MRAHPVTRPAAPGPATDGGAGAGPVVDEIDAAERAEALLLSCLTPLQAVCYRAHGYFLVQGDSGLDYIVRDECQYNVDTGRGYALCAVPDDHSLPLEDDLLAQKLWLEADEAAFWGKANIRCPTFGSLMRSIADHLRVVACALGRRFRRRFSR